MELEWGGGRWTLGNHGIIPLGLSLNFNLVLGVNDPQLEKDWIINMGTSGPTGLNTRNQLLTGQRRNWGN